MWISLSLIVRSHGAVAPGVGVFLARPVKSSCRVLSAADQRHSIWLRARLFCCFSPCRTGDAGVSCFRLTVTRLSYSHLAPEPNRAEIADCRLTSGRIVGPLDVVERSALASFCDWLCAGCARLSTTGALHRGVHEKVRNVAWRKVVSAFAEAGLRAAFP
jgi:hypothetical protein